MFLFHIFYELCVRYVPVNGWRAEVFLVNLMSCFHSFQAQTGIIYRCLSLIFMAFARSFNFNNKIISSFNHALFLFLNLNFLCKLFIDIPQVLKEVTREQTGVRQERFHFPVVGVLGLDY